MNCGLWNKTSSIMQRTKIFFAGIDKYMKICFNVKGADYFEMKEAMYAYHVFQSIFFFVFFCGGQYSSNFKFLS